MKPIAKKKHNNPLTCCLVIVAFILGALTMEIVMISTFDSFNGRVYYVSHKSNTAVPMPQWTRYNELERTA